MSSKKGILFVVSGPSGAGKGTVLKQLFKLDSSLYYSVSVTTRAPRNNEKEAINYYFLSKDNFRKMINEDRLLEYTEFCDNYYGTPIDNVDKKLNEGIDVILEIEVNGAKQVKEKRPESILIFIMPPSVDELKQRLVGRNTESEEIISQRLKEAEIEMKQVAKYDYLVVNDFFKRAAVKLFDIIKLERQNKL